MGRKALPRLALALAVALPLTACDTEALLEVDEPSYATPGSLRNPAGIPVLYAGALGDFQIGMSGADLADSYLAVTSMFSDEMRSGDTFTSRNANDQRNAFPTVQGNAESDRAYNQLQYARRSLAETAEIIVEVMEAGKADHRYARLKALEGLTIVGLAEAFCGAVPLSESRSGVPVTHGNPLTTAQLFEAAIERFDEAIAAAALGTVDTANHRIADRIARVGKARALLGLGRYADAATAVAGVPTSFVFFIEHSSNSARQRNPIFALQDNRRYTMSDNEGGNGLPYMSANDPRVPYRRITSPASAGLGFDNATPLWRTGRYRAFGDNVPVSDGVYARLAEAEADLKNGGTAWLTILNDLRSNVGPLMTARYGAGSRDATLFPAAGNTLPALTDPGTPAARVDLLFRERAFWMYLTGHRMGDMRRLVRQYGRDPETVFPTGTWHKGGEYGTDVNFPIPFNEINNPNFQHSACDVSQA